MSLIGDHDRARAAASLRRHYVQGRLSVDEFADRLEVALRARSDSDLQPALDNLPAPWQNLQEVVVPAARAASRAVGRAAALLALLTVWMLFSIVLLVAFAGALLIDGPSLAEVLGFPLVWLLATYGLWRLWARSPTSRT